MTAYAEVIGDPIAQSKSPLIHGFWLNKLGLEAQYRRQLVTPAELSEFLARRADDPDWRGCNVTMPHKTGVLDLVADPGNVRDSIGAMNTIVRNPDGSIFGTNTDAAGFFAPIADLPLGGAHIAVVGTGGAALAVLFALSRAEVATVTMIARAPLKGAALLARFGLKGQVVGIEAPLPPVALLVNASALGMAGLPAYAPDLSVLPDSALVYDLVYAPIETLLLKAAAVRGLETIGGLDMLVGQAAVAFELFFGAEAPRAFDDELRALLTA